jgi:hypothetical protein
MRARSSAEATCGRRPRPSGSRSAAAAEVVVAARSGRLRNHVELAGAGRELDDRLLEVAEVERLTASLGALYQAPPETLGEFAVGWLDRYALRVRPSSLDRARDLTQHLEVFRTMPLDEIRPAAVEDHIAALAKRAPR